MNRSQLAWHGVHTRQGRVFGQIPRGSQRSGACASVTRQPVVRWRSQLARRTTVLHRMREASRPYRALPCCVDRPQPAGHGARAASSRVSLPPERQPPQWRARASVTRKLAARWRPQLARPTTVLHRRREALRRCSALLYHVYRFHPARHGARALQPRVFCHLPRDSQRSGACSCAT